MAGCIAALFTALLLTLPAAGARAEDFDVRTASMGLTDGAWRLSARIEYRLTDEAIAALENGVMLTIRVELGADRVRRWLPNTEVLAVHRDWQLSYEPLTKRYLVAYPDGRADTSHGTDRCPRSQGWAAILAGITTPPLSAPAARPRK